VKKKFCNNEKLFKNNKKALLQQINNQNNRTLVEDGNRKSIGA
jgi:hypothetical protein